MKKKLLYAVVGLSLTCSTVSAQDNPQPYRNFPIIITVQFHALTLPFRHLNFNFRNVGFGVGTEVSFNGKGNAVQQMSMLWYQNRVVGNGFLLYTQSVWRPGIGADIFGEIKFGAGYLLAKRPSASFKRVNGDWVSVGRKGKGMFTVPIGVSLGYNSYSPTRPTVSPFVSYQFLVVNGYNQSVPVIPETLIQVGTAIQAH